MDIPKQIDRTRRVMVMAVFVGGAVMALLVGATSDPSYNPCACAD